MTIEELTDYLKAECEKCGTVGEYMDTFERMANLPVEAEYPIDFDEMELYYNIPKYGADRELEFLLSRSIPDPEPNIRKGGYAVEAVMKLHFEAKECYLPYIKPYGTMHVSGINERLHSDFLAEVRGLEIYKLLVGEPVKRCEVYLNYTF